MTINNTQYQVKHQGRIVATGNMKQCLLYLFNAFPQNTTMREIEQDGICIEPVEKGGAA